MRRLARNGASMCVMRPYCSCCTGKHDIMAGVGIRITLDTIFIGFALQMRITYQAAGRNHIIFRRSENYDEPPKGLPEPPSDFYSELKDEL